MSNGFVPVIVQRYLRNFPLPNNSNRIEAESNALARDNYGSLRLWFCWVGHNFE